MANHSHSQSLYTVEQMRVLERHAFAALGVAGTDLMRRAASAALNSLRRHWPQARRISIYCGPGNNGGDGFLLGVLAREAGLSVTVFALGGPSHGDAALARSDWESDGGQVLSWTPDIDLPSADVHVDALYGIGLNRAPEPWMATLLERIKALAAPVLALDVPQASMRIPVGARAPRCARMSLLPSSPTNAACIPASPPIMSAFWKSPPSACPAAFTKPSFLTRI